MKIRQKYLLYTLAVSSSFIAAFVTSIDSIISANFIKNPYEFTFSLFLVGVIVTLILSLVFSIPFKKKSLGNRFIDPSFVKLRLIQSSEFKYHLLAGLFNAVNTIGYCILISMILEPSLILSFSQIVIIYLLLIESISEKNIPTLVEVQSSVIVTFGAILASISLKGDININALLIVFLIINPTWAFFSIYQRKLKLLKIKERHNDAINIRFWNVFFSLVFTTIILLIIDFFTGTHYVVGGIAASIHSFSWVAFGMGMTFFAYVLYIRSLGLGKASVNNAIRSTTIIFGIPFSLMLASFFNIPLFSTDPVMLIIKIIGITLIVLGIITFALTLVKAYIFITIRPGFSLKKTMAEIWNIHGVSRVTATTGPYDFIVKIHTRTLVKGYERIIRKIEAIEAVKDYKWASVLKEWENI